MIERVVDGVGEVSGGIGFGEIVLEGGDVDFDGLGFDGPEALLAPFAEDGVGEQVDFVGEGGLIFEDVAVEEALKGGLIFDGKEGMSADGGQAVLEGIAGGLGFASRGAGPMDLRALLRLASIWALVGMGSFDFWGSEKLPRRGDPLPYGEGFVRVENACKEIKMRVREFDAKRI